MALSLFAGLASTAVAGNVVSYTDWTSASSPGVSASASGTLALSSGTVNISYNGEFAFAQVNNGGIQYWTQPNPLELPYTGNAVVGNAPSTTDIIALSEQSPTEVNTITFSQAVLNPIMLINSLGQPNLEVDYVFNQPVTLLSSGQGYWGGGPLGLTVSGDATIGLEGAGAIEFLGEVSSISWTTRGKEYWNGFTIGAVTDQTRGVPDGGTTVALLGVSLSCLAGFRRKK